MKTSDLAARLDALFRVEDYPPEDFAEVEDFCREAGIPLERYATAGFMQRHNGLMLANSDVVERVYTVVFPSDEVLDEVARLAEGHPAFVFTHHPMDFETSGRGLIPMGEALLQRLREAGISLYSAHAPLDCHDTISTSRSLARAAGVRPDGVCAGYYGGHAGLIGVIDETSLDVFVDRLRNALEVQRMDTHAPGDRVARVAVVAGGAAFPPMMQEAIDRGCDTYFTGDFRVRHGGPWAEEHHPQFDAYIEKVPINLIGGSHYATEALVLRHEMLAWFNSLGLPAEFVPQEDAWR
jgi:putative NIF3 family GTP cyclohydrolase 1 type 2